MPTPLPRKRGKLRVAASGSNAVFAGSVLSLRGYLTLSPPSPNGGGCWGVKRGNGRGGKRGKLRVAASGTNTVFAGSVLPLRGYLTLSLPSPSGGGCWGVKRGNTGPAASGSNAVSAGSVLSLRGYLTLSPPSPSGGGGWGAKRGRLQGSRQAGETQHPRQARQMLCSQVLFCRCAVI